MNRVLSRCLRQLVNFQTVPLRNLCIHPALRKGASAEANRSDKDKDSSSKGTEQAAPEELKTSSVKVEKDVNITLIGINRPEVRNAIDAEAAQKLCDAFDDFEQDATSPVAVLYGIGGSFCSGYDLHELGRDEKNYNVEMLLQAEGAVGPTRRHIKKPVVCAISGFCVANGLELALMCDLRVMEESAILGFFNRKLGVPLIDGGTARLPAMIGFSRALDLILTGRQVDAKEAFSMGIANRLVATGTSLGQAVSLACCISKFPQASLIHDRNSVYSATFETHNFAQSVQNEVMYTSKDVLKQMKTGIKKFNEGEIKNPSLEELRRDAIQGWEQSERDIESKIKKKS